MGHGTSLSDRAHGAAAADEASSWVERLARVGYAAKGFVYIVIGVLAVMLAVGVGGGQTTGSSGALRTLADEPFGQVLLAVIGIGLIGYTIWRLLTAAKNTEGHDENAKGYATRGFEAFKGLLYGALGVEALRLAFGNGGGQGGGAQSWTAQLLAAPAGRWLVGLAGAGVILYALAQLRAAWTRDLDDQLDLRSASLATALRVKKLARVGLAARGVVLALIGFFLVQAALQHDASEAGGLDQALSTVARQPYGMVLLFIVAVGLICYGVYMFAKAKYRRVEV